MEKAEFENKMMKAIASQDSGENTDYWTGYIYGLQRRYHGEDFIHEEMHELYMGLINDPLRIELGKGYRDGFLEVSGNNTIN